LFWSATTLNLIETGANMPFTKNKRLDTGDSFPEITFQSITGYTFDLPKEFTDAWSVVLLYRGDW
jgi:hypothetical protein